MVTLVCHFFTLMFLARLLEEVTMGVYFIALMVSFLLKLLSDFGVDLAFVKQYPEAGDSGKSRLLRSAFMLRFTFCTVVSLLYIAVEASATISFINEIKDVTALTLVLYWMHSFRELILRLLQAEQSFNVYAGTQVLAAVIKALLILSLSLLENVGVGTVLSIEIFAFAVSIAYAGFRSKTAITGALKARLGGAVELLRFGYPLYLNALLNLGNEKVSQYIVAGYGGPLAMAYFGMAERLSDAGTRLFESFANVYYPSQTKHFAEGNRLAAHELANRSLLWIAFIISAGIVTFAVLREIVIVLFFTEKYLTVANAATIFFGVLLLRSTQTLMGYFGVSAGEKFLPVKVSAVSSIFNIIVCVKMFHSYGYQGAIAALVLTQILMNVLYFIWLRKAGLKLDIKPLCIVLAACALSLCWVYYFTGSVLTSAFGIALFLAICILLLPSLRADIALGTRKLSALKSARQSA